MGLNPALAVSLQRGEEAAAELAAIPDSEALQSADDALMCSDMNDHTGAPSNLEAKIERMVASFRNGRQPNFGDASPIELLAFCIASQAIPKYLADASPIQVLAVCSLSVAKLDRILRGTMRANSLCLNTD
jgi:hypothetical protein